jgi:hypothetical protein
MDPKFCPNVNYKKRPANLIWLGWRQVYNSRRDSGPAGSNSSRSCSGGSPAGVVALEWLGGLVQMTRSSTKRERWLLVYGLRKFRVPKQQERALAEVILDGIAPMLNVTEECVEHSSVSPPIGHNMI